MRSIYTFIFILSSLTISSSWAQEDASWSLEIDPIAYVLNGYSIHILHQSQSHWRVDAGIFGLDLPENSINSLQENPQTVSMQGWGLKLDKMWRSVFLGVQYNSVYFIQKNEQITRQDISLRFGYQGYIGQNFYWQPWVAWGPTWGEDNFNNSLDEVKNIPFATIHLGWRF